MKFKNIHNSKFRVHSKLFEISFFPKIKKYFFFLFKSKICFFPISVKSAEKENETDYLCCCYFCMDLSGDQNECAWDNWLCSISNVWWRMESGKFSSLNNRFLCIFYQKCKLTINVDLILSPFLDWIRDWRQFGGFWTICWILERNNIQLHHDPYPGD